MKRKTVTLCMIARDEESSIGKAIKSALALVDEIVVVDTGSRDNTRIIAEGYGARVVDHPWQDDFAAARNAGLAEASCDWILVLDTDEQLQSVRPVEFQRLLHERDVAGYRVKMVSPRGASVVQSFPLVRLFRNHPDVRYRYPVHEQIVPSLNVLAAREMLRLADSPLVIHHTGYGPHQHARKRDRNLRLLRRAVAGFPEEPYFEFQLASETISKLDEEVLPVGGLATGREHLEGAWRKVAAMPPEMRRLVAYGEYLGANLAAALLAEGKVAEAQAVLDAARSTWGDRPLLLLQAVAANIERLRGESDPEVRRQLGTAARRDLRLLQADPGTGIDTAIDPRITDLYPLRYLGELALLEGDVARASELFEQALTHDGKYSSAWLGLAECAEFAGDRKRALKLYLRAVTTSEWNHRAWLRGHRLMEDLGFHDNAVSWRRKVTEHFPEHPALRDARSAPTPG